MGNNMTRVKPESRVPFSREWVVLAIILICTLFYRLYFMKFYDVMSADGTSYASSGKAFFETWDPHVFGTVQPPLYPFFVGLFNIVLHDLERAARSVSVVFSTITIVPLYLMAREFFDKRAAFCATLLFATLPFIHGMSGIDITEPTYTFFAFAGAYAFWKGFSGKRPVFFAIAGIVLGLAYLARPEGVIVSVALTLFFAVLGVRIFGAAIGFRKIALFLGMFWCGFTVMALPYLGYLHSSTGKWQLSGKTGLNSNIIREYRGYAPADQHLRLDSKGETVGGGDATLLDLMKNEPELFWGNIRENVKALPKEFNGVFPLYMWPFVIVGLIDFPWRKEQVGMRLLLAGMCAPLALYVLYFIQARGFYAYVPVLLVLAGGGCVKIEGWLHQLARRPAGAFPVMLPAVILLSAYYVYIELPRPKPPYEYTQDGGRYDDKQIGMRLRASLPETAVIMTRSGRIGFYSQRSYVLPPQGSFEEIIAFARKNNVEYLIATVQLLSMRPQLEALYAPLLAPGSNFTPPPGMELVYKGAEPGGLPYLVYRLR